MKKGIVILGLVFASIATYGSHVVGGELYYNKLGGTNQYEIIFKIYFDCFNANDGVIDRDGTNANIGVFNATTNNLMQSFIMTGASSKEVESESYECVKKPSGVCVIEYIYKKVVTIDPGTSGAIVAHQLCCRNSITKNVMDAGQTGSTYWCYIPPSAMTNSSPRFNTLPPPYICKDAPLSVDYSATDPNGDSLVYELYTPDVGGSASDPKPNLPSKPPYSKLIWNSGFNTASQITASPALYLNSSTGELTLTPTSTGTYAIGVRVSEYRNGSYIGSTIRDYQFTVVNCVFDVLADYDVVGATAVDGAYSFNCGDTVQFNNKSYSKNPPRYHWDFGVEGTNDDTSNLKDPTFVFPGNGDYIVTLTVISEICEDTYKYSVRIRSSQPFDLGRDRILCDDFEIFLDTKTPDAVSILWSTGATGTRILAKDEGEYSVTVSYGKCVYYDTINFAIDRLPEWSLPEDSLFCDDVDMTLDVGLDGYVYAWNTSSADRNRTVRVRSAGTYIAAVSNTNCTEYDTTRIWQATQPRVEDSTFCNEFEYDVDVGSIEEASYLWSNGATTPSTTITTGGTNWVRVTQRHCVKSDSFFIDNPVITFDLQGDMHFCDAFTRTLDGGPDGISYVWSTGETSRSITVDTAGTFAVFVRDAFGCTREDSVVLSVSQSPNIFLGNDTTICLTSPTLIGVDDIYAEYEWTTGDKTATIITEKEDSYGLTVKDQYGCSGSDTMYITVDPEALPNDLYIPNAFTPNSDNLNELFPYKDPVKQPGYYVTIFTRWGEKVFDSRYSDTQNWDGTYKGSKVPQETHIYYIQYRGCDGNQRTRKGTVNPLY